MAFTLFSKIEVTFTLHSGAKVKVKCRKFDIKKNGNELVGYSAEGIDKRMSDSMFYIKLDSIDHIAYRKVFW